MVDRNRHHRGISRTDEEQLSRLEPRAAARPESADARAVPRKMTRPGRAYDSAVPDERRDATHDAAHTSLKERTVESNDATTGNVTHRNR